MTDYGIEFSKSGGIFSSINKSGTEKPPIFDPEARRQVLIDAITKKVINNQQQFRKTYH